MKIESRDLESQSAQLRQIVTDLGFPYKRQIDENEAKQAEQHSEIARLFKQMQAFREEAAETDIEVLRLKTVPADSGHERHVELVDRTLRPPRWRPKVTTTISMQQTSANKEPESLVLYCLWHLSPRGSGTHASKIWHPRSSPWRPGTRRQLGTSTLISVLSIRLPISMARRARRIACWRSYTRLRSRKAAASSARCWTSGLVSSGSSCAYLLRCRS